MLRPLLALLLLSLFACSSEPAPPDLTPPVPVCGNGVVESGEECDDDNLDNDDGCSSTCRIEEEEPVPVCGNGVVESGEECDDGNGVDTDACSNACVSARCGDGLLQTGEFCDDGNEEDDDGCSNSCHFALRFTSAGTVGRRGPTQAAVDAAYAGTYLEGRVTVTETGIQKWVVPSTGSYRIETYGAQGAVGARLHQSKGAAMRGTFDLSAGDILWILVGQKGEGEPGTYAHTGGGGGSFVARGPALVSSEALIVSGGGFVDYFEWRVHGGERDSGSLSTSGHAGQGPVAGGTEGSKGGAYVDTYTAADPAAGFFSGQGGSSSRAFQDGGLGSFFAGASGGFGGGGAVSEDFYAIAGGGGGYSGGGSSEGSNGNTQYGGGGGSFNSGRDPQNETNLRQGHGLVVVTEL